MTDLRRRLRELDELDAPDMRAGIDRRVGELRSVTPWVPTRSSDRPWRGPFIAVGIAAGILVLVGVVAMLFSRTDPTEVDVAGQPTPPTTISADVLVPARLVAPENIAWSVGGLHHGVAYVDSIDKVIMFGGHGGDNDLLITDQGDQTLLVDLDTLAVERVEAAAGPPARSFHAIAYDAQSDRVILFGGVPAEYDGDNDLGDTWAFEPVAGTWEEMQPALSPPATSFHDMVYHASLDRIVLVGAFGVWLYDYESDTWEEHLTAESPPWHGYQAGSAAVDESTGRIVTVSEGESPLGPLTGVLDLGTGQWHPEPWFPELGEVGTSKGSNGPPGVRAASVVYDPQTDQVIGFGYLDDEEIGVVIAYDAPSDTWTRIGVGPPIWGRTAMVYDPQRRQIVLFQPLGGDPTNEPWTVWTMPIGSDG